MGASHTTLASTSSVGGEEGILPELESAAPTNNAGNNNNNNAQTSGAKHDLSAYSLDQPLFPGSGRMMRTFRLRHKQNGSAAILKTMYVSKEHETLANEQEQELKRILQALHGMPHVTPFLYWSLGPYKPKPSSNNVPAMVRQVSLLRPHMYTTLSDRLASRPFLTHVEKLWIVYQLLQALEAMHAKGIVHGFLTTENIGLSSWNWVVVLDVASYKARTALPDDDPTEYLYYFQENYSNSYAQGTDTTRREKRCYLAPERFYTPNLEQPQPPEQQKLTPAMDIFSAGCVMMETFLNGERALDLGDLMEYRKQQSSPTLQQNLNKIEFSALRAACRHMLHLDPTERLSANAYLERLEASELVPGSFSVLATMMEKVTYAPPDARLAIATAFYTKILWEALGIHDVEGSVYVQNILGSTMARQMQAETTSAMGGIVDRKESSPDLLETNATAEEKKEDLSLSNADLFAETEALLKQLEALSFDEGEILDIAAKETSLSTTTSTKISTKAQAKRSEISQSSLLIYLQLILSTVRHVQRPSSKLVALQLMSRLGKFSSDEARLQRIVPVTVSLLHDQDPLVRASAIQVLAKAVSTIESFPPSDSKVFPEYIFKRVAHLITDPALVVRLAFAKSVAVLAETSQRFLDISHAVRLYEAVGGGGVTNPTAATGKEVNSVTKNVFTDDIAKLLDESSSGGTGKKKRLESAESSGLDSTSSDGAVGTGKTLISSTYTTELGTLHEAVSRWVVHITTDQSEQSSPAKRALLGDMARLCNFFGLDGVMAFILPQVLSFLNDRKDWQLRVALFDCLPSVCHIIGRAATEHFVLPCLETALVDGTESVVSRALKCLSQLLSMGLLSRSVLLGTPSMGVSEPSNG
jgi:phosphoinositide-3-kinase regulatory subunit 4